MSSLRFWDRFDEQCLNPFHNFTGARIQESGCIDNLPVIKVNTEFTDPTCDKLYIYVVLLSQLRRHTGSDDFFDGSKCTVMNRDLHINFLR